MATPMEVVKQTGKTIIFEKFVDYKYEYKIDESGEKSEKEILVDDLLTLLIRDTDKLSKEKFITSMNEKLAVKSFDEFLKKFSPTVYESFYMTDDGKPQFVYSLEKPLSGMFNKINLTDHEFYKMIRQIMDKKTTSGASNIEFDYEKIKETLSPKSALNEAKQIRKNLESNAIEYFKLKEKNVPTADEQRFAKNLIDCRKKIVSKYEGKSPLALLPLAIADTQDKIDQLNSISGGNDSTNNQIALPGYFQFDVAGRLELKKYDVSSDSDLTTVKSIENSTQKQQQKLIEVVKKDFEKAAPPALKEGNFVSNMIVNSFVASGTNGIAVINKNELEVQKKQYQELYKDSLESFTKAVSTAVEKLVGVKSFFDHATVDGKLADDVSVLITNCKIDDILNNEIAKERFTEYFKALGNEKDKSRIWFGVIPAIAYGDMSYSDDSDFDPFADLDIGEDKTHKKNGESLVSLNDAKEMLQILKEAKIMTFINFKASEDTGFVELTDKKVRDYKSALSNVNSEYAVFSYPNFTVLPKEKTSVEIGKNNEAFVQVPGIYLESAYVAAGLVVGTQNYKLLKSCGLKINENYPCVHFDFEYGDNSKIVLSKINRETIMEMDQSIKNEVLVDRFGFFFADNSIYFNNKKIDNSYVFNARSLKKGKGAYKSIYKTLVNNFVTQYVKSLGDPVRKNAVDEFIKITVEEWKDDNKDSSKKVFANKILFDGESIKYSTEDKKIQVLFGPELEIIEDVDVTDTETSNTENK